MAIAFRHYHYECFCSQINLDKLTFVYSGLGNSLNKKCVRLSDAATLKMLFFSLKIHKNQEKRVAFCLKCAFLRFLWKLPLFSKLVGVSHIKWRPTALKWMSFVFSTLFHFRLKTVVHAILVIVSTEDFH